MASVPSSIASLASPPAGWTAKLSLGFASRPGGSYLARRRHEGPLAVQRAFFPEGPAVAHVYLLHPPGGLVAGDILAIDVAVDPGAHALITTPAAGKAYRSGGERTAQVSQRLSVGAGSTLEWFPQETIVFDGARVDLETTIDLAADARFFGWELICYGRPAAGERFTRGFCQQRLMLRREGRPLAIDRTRIVGGGPLLDAPFGLGGHPVQGTFYIAPAGEALTAVLADVRAEIAEMTAPTELCSLSLVQGALIVRTLGASAERARQIFARVWTRVRPILCGRQACPPRIWLT